MGFPKDSAFKQEEDRQTIPVQSATEKIQESIMNDYQIRLSASERYASALKNIRWEVSQYDMEVSSGEEALTFISNLLDSAGF